MAGQSIIIMAERGLADAGGRLASRASSSRGKDPSRTRQRTFELLMGGRGTSRAAGWAARHEPRLAGRHRDELLDKHEGLTRSGAKSWAEQRSEESWALRLSVQ